MTGEGIHRWSVEVTGDEADLAWLATHLAGREARVLRAPDGKYRFVSPRFGPLTDAASVFGQARSELRVLAGLLHHRHHRHPVLHVGAVLDEAPGRPATQILFAHAFVEAVARIGAVSIGHAGPDGAVSALQIAAWVGDDLQLAMTDAAVAKVFRLQGEVPAEPWVQLSRIYEVIEGDVGGEGKLAAAGLVNGSEHKRFKHTANSVTATGDLARHGAETKAPPKKPMTLPEAEAFVRHLLGRWLERKHAAQTSG